MADGTPSQRADHAKIVAERLIEQLKSGTAPWQKPWAPGEGPTLPYNGATGKPYRGGNSVWLAMQGRGDPRWMTFNQANAAGASVRKGEHGVQIEYWMHTAREKVTDAAGKPVRDESGRAVYHTVELERPRVMHFRVFNGEQIDGLPKLAPKEPAPEWRRHELAEAILKNSGARIQHVSGDQAFYSPTHDAITLPERGQFANGDRYYATALHELSHWTGHESRLNRPAGAAFGSEQYAREELRAEIGSMMLGDRIGVGHAPDADGNGQHAAYVASWIEALREDPREIFRAARDAEKIADYVMQFEPAHEHQQHETQEQRDALSDAATAVSEYWRRDEWKIDPALHASAVPELGQEAGQLRAEADARDAAADNEEDEGMDMG